MQMLLDIIQFVAASAVLVLLILASVGGTIILFRPSVTVGDWFGVKIFAAWIALYAYCMVFPSL